MNNEVIINNFSKNIQIIDAGDEIVSLKKTTNLQEQVRIMIDIALAKGWKLENIEAIGDDSFIYEVNRQIAKALEEKNKSKNIDSEIMITRAKTELQQQNINMKDKELLKTINISELKEKLNANLVLQYAVENYKLDINKYEITRDNRIDNIKNKQKPKNVIDFLQKELNLSSGESIEICTKIYEKNKQYRSQNIPNYRKKQKN